MLIEGIDGLCKAPAKEEGRGRPKGERDKIKFIDLRSERWQLVGIEKGRRKQVVP